MILTPTSPQEAKFVRVGCDADYDIVAFVYGVTLTFRNYDTLSQKTIAILKPGQIGSARTVHSMNSADRGIADRKLRPSELSLGPFTEINGPLEIHYPEGSTGLYVSVTTLEPEASVSASDSATVNDWETAFQEWMATRSRVPLGTLPKIDNELARCWVAAVWSERNPDLAKLSDSELDDLSFRLWKLRNEVLRVREERKRRATSAEVAEPVRNKPVPEPRDEH